MCRIGAGDKYLFSLLSQMYRSGTCKCGFANAAFAGKKRIRGVLEIDMSRFLSAFFMEGEYTTVFRAGTAIE